MKRKCVEIALRAAFDKWVGSVADKNVEAIARNRAYITGGAIASLLIGEKVKDFDIYVRDMESALAICRYYIASDGECFRGISADPRPDGSGVLLSAAIGDFGSYSRYFETPRKEASDLTVSCLSTNAVTLAGGYQIVHRFVGEPDSIDDSFDFAHCSNYWSPASGLVLRPKALESIVTRDLLYTGSKYPICSLVRLRKFLLRGWIASAGQLLKIALEISKLNLGDMEVLREQLEGVDVGHFKEVVEALEGKGNKKIDTSVIVEILDRLH